MLIDRFAKFGIVESGVAEATKGSEVFLDVVLVRPIPTATAVTEDVLASGVTEERDEVLHDVVLMSRSKTLTDLIDQKASTKALGFRATNSTQVAASFAL